MPFFGHRRRQGRLPPEQRVYAIGDVHGEAALLNTLLLKIADDSRARADVAITLILLGDYIDRGPDSAVILQTLALAKFGHVVALKGNHEAAMVDAYRGDDRALAFWLRFGGRATLASFGIDLAQQLGAQPDALRAAMHRRIAPDLIDWLDQRPTHIVIGDYLFVHAGIRPGIPLERQSEEDMLWIREPFLASRRDFGKIVVHGHSMHDAQVTLGRNRINLDTGAYAHGRLTALGLEGDEQWTLDVSRDSTVAGLIEQVG